jgi:hypothetical protein
MTNPSRSSPVAVRRHHQSTVQWGMLIRANPYMSHTRRFCDTSRVPITSEPGPYPDNSRAFGGGNLSASKDGEAASPLAANAQQAGSSGDFPLRAKMALKPDVDQAEKDLRQGCHLGTAGSRTFRRTARVPLLATRRSSLRASRLPLSI